MATLVVLPYQKSVNFAPALNTIANVTTPSMSSAGQVVITGFLLTLTVGATPPIAELEWRVIDTVTADVYADGFLIAPANGSAIVQISGLSIPAAPRSRVTLEFLTAPGATNREAVNLFYYFTDSVG